MSALTGGEYRFNFQDLSRFVNDVRYLFRTGGNVFQAGGGIDLLAIRENLITIILLTVLIYILYYLFFKGYPRILTNLAMFSFYHKESMDGFLKKDNILYDAMTKLSQSPGYELFDFVYGTSDGSQLYSAVSSARKTIQASYVGLKPDAQVYESLRDYFIFQDRYQGTAVEITTPKEKVVVKNKEFYEQLLGFLTNIGKYSPKSKGDDEQLIDMYRLDEKQGFKLYNRALACKQAYDNISMALVKVVPKLAVPYLAYVVLPENAEDYKAAAVDFERLGKSVYTPGVYLMPVEKVNPFSWFVIEVAQYKQNSGQYSSFASEIQSIGYGGISRPAIIKYLNLPPQQRKIAVTRVFKDRVPKDFYIFVNKRPIFSHVYFSNEIADKAGFYDKVMKVYLKYYSESNGRLDTKQYLSNLSMGVKQTKVLMAYMHSLNLFMNVYKQKIVTTYQDQNYANKFFFSRLFNPFFDDFVKNRMATKVRKTFSKEALSESYDQFGKMWEKLGKVLKNLINDLPDQFS